MSRNVPLPFKFTSESQCSIVCSSSGRLIAMAALFTRISTLPNSWTAASMRVCGPERVDMSAQTAIDFWGREDESELACDERDEKG